MKARNGGILADLTYIFIGAVVVIGIAYSAGFRYTKHANNAVVEQPKRQAQQSAKIDQKADTPLNTGPLFAGAAVDQSSNPPAVSVNTKPSNISETAPQATIAPSVQTDPNQSPIKLDPATVLIVPMPPTIPPNCSICGRYRLNNPTMVDHIMCPLSSTSAYACIL